MLWGLLVAVVAPVTEAVVVHGHLRNASRGNEAFKTSIPRGGGQAVCMCWMDSKLREERMKPYIHVISGGSVPEQGVFEEVDRICAVNSGGTPMEDGEAYKTLHEYIENNRQKQTSSPFTHSYYSGDGFMLSVFHRRFKIPAENLHCIEVGDFVPEERKGDFQLHVLKDPMADLKVLSEGPLKGYFDATSSFAVFHHIPDKAVRENAFASIALMLKPKAPFLLADWGSYGKPLFDVWYDVAHVLLWLFGGSAPPAGPVDIGTQYEGLSKYIELAGSHGLSPQKEHSSSRADMDASPLGSFAQVFVKGGNWFGSLANTGEGLAPHGDGVTHAMPLG